MKKIKYIAFYSDDNHESENRYYALSAKNKVDYITKSLIELGYTVEIVSPSWTKKNRGYFKSTFSEINSKKYLRLFNTFGVNSRILKPISHFFSLIQLFIYLIVNVKKDEIIISYHSVTLVNILLLIKKVKKVQLILEVEEIYQDIQKLSLYNKQKEKKIFEIVDGYILSTDLLDDRINGENKPFVTVHGTYEVEEDRNKSFNDNKIHIVYAGTFDSNKGGAITAINSAKYLTNAYHTHIIGFGTEKQVELIKKLVNEVNQHSNSTITYDGLYTGEEFITFLQKCHIGLSTQSIVGGYNDSSFPSKVLTYMSNGLEVVSGRIKVVMESQITQNIYFYNSENPKEIAKIITTVNIGSSVDNRETLKKLHFNFKENLKGMLIKVNEKLT